MLAVVWLPLSLIFKNVILLTIPTIQWRTSSRQCQQSALNLDVAKRQQSSWSALATWLRGSYRDASQVYNIIIIRVIHCVLFTHSYTNTVSHNQIPQMYWSTRFACVVALADSTTARCGDNDDDEPWGIRSTICFLPSVVVVVDNVSHSRPDTCALLRARWFVLSWCGQNSLFVGDRVRGGFPQTDSILLRTRLRWLYCAERADVGIMLRCFAIGM